MTMHFLNDSLSFVSEAQVRAALGQASSFGGVVPPRSDRFDSDGWVAPADALDAYARHCDGLLLAEVGRRGLKPPGWYPQVYRDEAVRADAFTGGAGGFPRDFEYIRTRVYEEKRQPLSAMRLFPRDTEVPLGAKTHTARRALGGGEAIIHRGGDAFPRARTTYAEETFGVVYVVSAVATNHFEALTTDWAGYQQYQRDFRLGLRLVEEKLNRIAWSGDVPSKVYGVLNYPHLAKQVLATDFDGSADPEDACSAMRDFVNTPYIQSGTAFQPNRLVVSPAIWAYISGTKHSSTGGTDLTIAEFFLKSQDAVNGIRQIDVAPELTAIGPNGEDGMLAYRDEIDTIGHVLIQPPTPLPVFQSSPIDQITVIVGCTGGMVMPDVGNAILGLAVV